MKSDCVVLSVVGMGEVRLQQWGLVRLDMSAVRVSEVRLLFVQLLE